ncbi:MAG: diacylglycerol kinase family lipid kinase [Bacteroidales bacterium]|nr:diacylglycerol kinase family lipid kinase [Bacteroidales bacterium]MBN2819344.1 diacylglycerol kinase family lipid kinase [Bacteroidales bacterium]
MVKSDSGAYKSTGIKEEWLLLLNPHAGCSKGLEDKELILSKLREKKIKFKLVTSDYPRHSFTLVKQYIEEGFRKIIVAGGDGTLNEVVNGIFLQEATDPENIKLGMIPIGTGNDWIKTFGIPLGYDESIQTIIENKVVKQDIGKITYSDNNEENTRFFANIAGFGFDAMVAERANALKAKGKKGLIVYLQSLLGSFFSYKICRAKIQIDKQEIEDYIFTSSIGIGKFNGGGMMQTPYAIPNNGRFQITVIKKIGLFGIIRNLARLYKGTFVKDHRVSTYTCKEVYISGVHTIPGEVDGESLGNHSFHIVMIPEKLQVIYGDDKYLFKDNLETVQDEPSLKESVLTVVSE